MTIDGAITALAYVLRNAALMYTIARLILPSHTNMYCRLTHAYIDRKADTCVLRVSHEQLRHRGFLGHVHPLGLPSVAARGAVDTTPTTRDCRSDGCVAVLGLYLQTPGESRPTPSRPHGFPSRLLGRVPSRTQSVSPATQEDAADDSRSEPLREGERDR